MYNNKEVSAGIKLFFQLGNYFIMDSETLVSNVYHESQQEAIIEVLKKNSLTEKLTSVKNKVCEKQYLITKTRLENERMRRLKQLLDCYDSVRHEAKLIDLNRQRHWIEMRKRVLPGSDFNYQETQLRNNEKRLGLNTAPCYLDRKQRYPVRLRSANDTGLTPTVRKARAILIMQDLQKSKEKNLSTSHTGVLRDKSAQICFTVPGRESGQHRFISAQVSAVSTHAGKLPPNHNMREAISNTNFFTVDNHGEDQSKKCKKYKSCMYKLSQNKFSPSELSLKIPPKPKTDATKITKSDASYRPKTGSYTNELSDEDGDQLPDHVDLRAHFLTDNMKVKDKGNRVFTGPGLNSVNHHLLGLRQTQRASREFTIDSIRAQAGHINAKVQKFVKDLAVPQHKANALVPTQSQDCNRNITAKPTTFEGSSINCSSLIKSSTMPDLQCHTINDGSISVTAMKDANRERVEDSPTVTEKLHRKPRKVKYSWELIKGRPEDGHQRGAYTAEDLVLQTLTGIPIRNVMQTPVPLHTACRATRRTSTFKMHKIVENLIKERTRYQKHVVEELKKQMIEVLKGQDTEGDESTVTEAKTPS